MAYFCCLLLAIVGLLMILKPALYWDLTESWKSNGTQPSSEYLDNIRIKGYMFAGFAVLLVLILLLS
ncbi:MAG: hypothetical protein IJX84_11750 [Clostridia bacterium]|nr:hypothetical protein [Clostridia bacterium]